MPFILYASTFVINKLFFLPVCICFASVNRIGGVGRANSCFASINYRIGGVWRANSFTVVEMKELCMEECHKWLVPCFLKLRL